MAIKIPVIVITLTWVSNQPIGLHQHGHTNFWYVCLLEKYISISKNAAIMYNVWYVNNIWSARARTKVVMMW